MGRRPIYRWDLLLDIDGTPCAAPRPCQGVHAKAWQLNQGEDFREEITLFSMQTAMHAKAQYLGLKCHTRKNGKGIQVQFYMRDESDA